MNFAPRFASSMEREVKTGVRDCCLGAVVAHRQTFNVLSLYPANFDRSLLGQYWRSRKLHGVQTVPVHEATVDVGGDMNRERRARRCSSSITPMSQESSGLFHRYRRTVACAYPWISSFADEAR